MISVKVEGLEPLRDLLSEFSDRRFQSAIAEAINRTARKVSDAWGGELYTRLDQPTPLTYRAARISERADVGRLQAVVSIRNDSNAYVQPAEYLATQETGAADRRLRRFEQALVSSGAMPAGHKAVPGEYAQLDQFGNVSRSQIIAVLGQLGGALTKGYGQVTGRTSSRRSQIAARSGRRYVAIGAGDRRAAGIYEVGDTGLKPVFFFVRSTRYKKRTRLLDLGQRLAYAELPKAIALAVDKRIASLRRRG
jgi:hypothetical protein